MLGPFATTSRLTPIHQVSPLYSRTPPAHRCPQRRQRQRVTEGTAMAPWNGPNKLIMALCTLTKLLCGYIPCVTAHCDHALLSPEIDVWHRSIELGHFLDFFHGLGGLGPRNLWWVGPLERDAILPRANCATVNGRKACDVSKILSRKRIMLACECI